MASENSSIPPAAKAIDIAEKSQIVYTMPDLSEAKGIIAAQPCPRELRREVAPRRRRMVLAACVLASSMAFIDGSALKVALPKLRAHFGADLASVQRVLNGYLLALASLTMNGGTLADVYGKGRVLSIGRARRAWSGAATAALNNAALIRQ